MTLIKWLLDEKKVPLDVEADGWTAVNYAVARGHAQAAQILLTRGASLTATTRPLASTDADAPAAAAEADNDDDAPPPAYDPNMPPPLVQGCVSGSIDMVELLLSMGYSFATMGRAERRQCIESALGT